MEDWSAAAEEMICEALNIQDYIQATDRHDHGEKPPDINWIPERTEGENMQEVTGNFIKMELSLPSDEPGILLPLTLYSLSDADYSRVDYVFICLTQRHRLRL